METGTKVPTRVSNSAGNSRRIGGSWRYRTAEGPPTRQEEPVRVEEIMSSPVTALRPDTPLKDAARVLVERDVSAAPVLDDADALVGLVSESDIMHIELHEDPRRHARVVTEEVGDAPSRVEEVMTRDVIAVPADADVADVAETMIEQRVRSLPVVAGVRVVGIVSRRDVLRVLVRSDADIARDLEDVLDELPSSLGSWSVRVEGGVVSWVGDGPEDVPPFLTRVAFTAPGVVDVRFVEPGRN